jgi:hypothetical protein
MLANDARADVDLDVDACEFCTLIMPADDARAAAVAAAQRRAPRACD